MVEQYDYQTATASTSMTCSECGKELGGPGQPDPYKHMIRCLNVEPDAVARIRAVALQAGNENGRRVIRICDFILARQ